MRRTGLNAMPLGVAGLLTALYFAQGVPFGFLNQAFPVILRESGYSLVAISATTLLFVPWALKFLWAPAVDRFGTRRQWLLALQFVAAGIALVLAAVDLRSGLALILIGTAVLNLVSATQDAVTDGLAVQVLGTAQRGVGNGIQAGAYRAGMIVGGGALLWLFSVAGWRASFVAMAVLLLAATVPVVWFPKSAAAREASVRSREPIRVLEWVRRVRRPGMIALIVAVGAYKLGDSMGVALVGPFLVDIGLSTGQIALLQGAVASVAALLGAVCGGVLTHRVGRRHALLVGGIAQTVGLGFYLVAALGVGGYGVVVVAVVAEQVCGGIATVAVFTLMMDAAEPAFASGDYSLLACSIVAVQGFAKLAAGVIGQTFGYPALYGTSIVLSAMGILVMLVVIDRGWGPVGVLQVTHLPPDAAQTNNYS